MLLISQIIGYRPRINTKSDAMCMDKYGQEAPEFELVMTKLGNVKDHLSVEPPLLDYLVTETEGLTEWKYPKLQDLKRFQERRGLNYPVINEVEVREIICGISTSEEMQLFHEWIMEEHLLNQSKFDTNIVSTDVEDVKASYYDIMRIVVIYIYTWNCGEKKLIYIHYIS